MFLSIYFLINICLYFTLSIIDGFDDYDHGLIHMNIEELLSDLMSNANLNAPDSPSSTAKLKKFARPSIAFPTCPLCHLTIDPSDEFSVYGVVWHTQCFRCGGKAEGLGCKKRIRSLEDFEEHNALPFCKACTLERKMMLKFNSVSGKNMTNNNNTTTVMTTARRSSSIVSGTGVNANETNNDTANGLFSPHNTHRSESSNKATATTIGKRHGSSSGSPHRAFGSPSRGSSKPAVSPSSSYLNLNQATSGGTGSGSTTGASGTGTSASANLRRSRDSNTPRISSPTSRNASLRQSVDSIPSSRRNSDHTNANTMANATITANSLFVSPRPPGSPTHININTNMNTNNYNSNNQRRVSMNRSLSPNVLHAAAANHLQPTPVCLSVEVQTDDTSLNMNDTIPDETPHLSPTKPLIIPSHNKVTAIIYATNASANTSRKQHSTAAFLLGTVEEGSEETTPVTPLRSSQHSSDQVSTTSATNNSISDDSNIHIEHLVSYSAATDESGVIFSPPNLNMGNTTYTPASTATANANVTTSNGQNTAVDNNKRSGSLTTTTVSEKNIKTVTLKPPAKPPRPNSGTQGNKDNMNYISQNKQQVNTDANNTTATVTTPSNEMSVVNENEPNNNNNNNNKNVPNVGVLHLDLPNLNKDAMNMNEDQSTSTGYVKQNTGNNNNYPQSSDKTVLLDSGKSIPDTMRSGSSIPITGRRSSVQSTDSTSNLPQLSPSAAGGRNGSSSNVQSLDSAGTIRVSGETSGYFEYGQTFVPPDDENEIITYHESPVRVSPLPLVNGVLSARQKEPLLLSSGGGGTGTTPRQSTSITRDSFAYSSNTSSKSITIGSPINSIQDDFQQDSYSILLSDLITFTDVTFNNTTYRGFHFTYEFDFDTKGVFYWIGTEAGTSTFFRNPHTAGYVICNMSSLYDGHLFNIVARSMDHAPNYTENIENSWIEVDLGPRRLLLPDKYTIRHGASTKGNVIRNWIVQGKISKFVNDNEDDEILNEEWITLKTHINDTSLSDEPNSTYSWDIDYPEEVTKHLKSIGFRYLRILQTGSNSNNNNCLFCCGVEFYGLLFEKVGKLKVKKIINNNSSNKNNDSMSSSSSYIENSNMYNQEFSHMNDNNNGANNNDYVIMDMDAAEYYSNRDQGGLTNGLEILDVIQEEASENDETDISNNNSDIESVEEYNDEDDDEDLYEPDDEFIILENNNSEK